MRQVGGDESAQAQWPDQPLGAGAWTTLGQAVGSDHLEADGMDCDEAIDLAHQVLRVDADELRRALVQIDIAAADLAQFMARAEVIAAS
jgi:hypothetical protein